MWNQTSNNRYHINPPKKSKNKEAIEQLQTYYRSGKIQSDVSDRKIRSSVIK